MLPAARAIRTRGPYAVVRHPIYLALVAVDAALLLGHPSLRNAALVSAGVGAHLLRVRLEEGVLATDPAYARYAATTRYRLLPGLW